jgi:ribonuclease I
MNQTKIAITALLLIGTALTQGPFTRRQTPKSYDYYMFATEWQGTVCMFKDCTEATTSPDVFNLHGLWPNAENGRHPFSCSKTPLNFAGLPSDLQSDLKSYWSGLYSSQEDFLKHEWSKHGTCWRFDYGDLSQAPEEVKEFVKNARSDGTVNPEWYMRLATSLSSKKYNLRKILADGDIKPDNSKVYQLDDVFAVIQKALGVTNVEVHCLRDETGRTFLSEFRTCLDKNYNPKDCAKKKGGSCNDQVFYPELEAVREVQE